MIGCPACRSDFATDFVTDPVDREYFHARELPTVIRRCSTCASLYQDPWPTEDELSSFYDADYQNYTSTSVPLLATINDIYQRRIGRLFLDEHGDDVSVLDFGCGQGGFLRTLAAAGCRRLAGFDFVLYDELNTIPGARFFDNLDELRSSSLRFDVIRMRHVIEHLSDVDGTMTSLGELLRDGGRIVGQTPNAAHHTARLTGRYWGPLHFPYHTVLFSPVGLESAAPRWGLRLGPTVGSILPSGWAISAENIYKAISGSRTRGRTAGYALLMAATLPLALIDRVLTPSATANFDFVLERA